MPKRVVIRNGEAFARDTHLVHFLMVCAVLYSLGFNRRDFTKYYRYKLPLRWFFVIIIIRHLLNYQVKLSKVMSKKYEQEGVSRYFTLEGSVSNGFNRLKGKMFNLIEATITDKQQCEAVKGLIKGFANDEYAICVSDMRYVAREMDILSKEESDDFPPMGAHPLEPIG